MVVKEALGELEGAVDEGGEELVAEAEDLFFDGKGPGALGGGKEGGEALFGFAGIEAVAGVGEPLGEGGEVFQGRF